jgi:hypothetical protein
LRLACRADDQAHCSSVAPGGVASLACLQQHAASLSGACQQALQAVAGAGAAPAKSAGAARPPGTAAAVARPGAAPADTWPHTVRAEGGSMPVYQPQVISWPDRQTLNTRIAMALTPNGGKAILGTVQASFSTSTDLASATVSLANRRRPSSRFAAADTAQAERFEQAIRSALAARGDKRVPLDMVLLSRRNGNETPPSSSAVQHTSPTLFVSQRAASLLVFDGEPVLAPVAGTPLAVAVNTNWDLFVDQGSRTWYWLNNGAWLRAADAKGPWAPAGTRPAALLSLPVDRNFADVRRQVPGRTIAAADMPQVFVSTTPAEIIVIDGAPRYVAIAGTQLQYVANTDAALFRDVSNGQMCYLVSGRWFSAASLLGPRTFATRSLPADFARVPANGPRGCETTPARPQGQAFTSAGAAREAAAPVGQRPQGLQRPAQLE